jgi:hypothetical protein
VGAIILVMLILALGIVATALTVLLAKREQPVGPVVRWVGGALGIVCLGLLVTMRAGPLVGLLVVGVGSFVLWLSMGGGGGGDGPGDDDPDPAPVPDPDPGPGERADVPAGSLDREAFDRARAEWERELPKRG